MQHPSLELQIVTGTLAPVFLETEQRKGRSGPQLSGRPDGNPPLCFPVSLFGQNSEWSLGASRTSGNCSLLLASLLLTFVCVFVLRGFCSLGRKRKLLIASHTSQSANIYCRLTVYVPGIVLAHYMISSALPRWLSHYPDSVVVEPKGVERLALARIVSSEVGAQVTSGWRAFTASLSVLR